MTPLIARLKELERLAAKKTSGPSLKQATAAGTLRSAASPSLTELAEALEGVIRVADRKTVEFDAARTALANLARRLGVKEVEHYQRRMDEARAQLPDWEKLWSEADARATDLESRLRLAEEVVKAARQLPTFRNECSARDAAKAFDALNNALAAYTATGEKGDGM